MLPLRAIAIFCVVVVAYGLPANDPRQLIRPNTPENIAKLSNLNENDNAELLSGQYQGDIVMTDDEIREIENSGKTGRAGLIAQRYNWAGAVVPFRIVEADFTREQIDQIHLGLKTLEQLTCLRFPAYDSRLHNDYVTVQGSSSGCFSSVGRRGTGEQILNLQPSSVGSGCFRIGTVMHEFIHAVGFFHAHSATERDEYVEIVWEKIQAGTENNFIRYEDTVISSYGVEYDYGSVMHYPTVAFSIDGSPTIVPKKPLNGAVMGQRLELSSNDIARLNNAYCQNLPVPPPPRPPHPIAQKVSNFVNNLLNNVLSGW